MGNQGDLRILHCICCVVLLPVNQYLDTPPQFVHLHGCSSLVTLYIAVSQKTVVWVEYGGGPNFFPPLVFFQLGRMGMLSCLHRALSEGLCLAFISLHR